MLKSAADAQLSGTDSWLAAAASACSPHLSKKLMLSDKLLFTGSSRSAATARFSCCNVLTCSLAASASIASSLLRCSAVFNAACLHESSCCKLALASSARRKLMLHHTRLAWGKSSVSATQTDAAIWHDVAELSVGMLQAGDEALWQLQQIAASQLPMLWLSPSHLVSACLTHNVCQHNGHAGEGITSGVLDAWTKERRLCARLSAYSQHNGHSAMQHGVHQNARKKRICLLVSIMCTSATRTR